MSDPFELDADLSSQIEDLSSYLLLIKSTISSLENDKQEIERDLVRLLDHPDLDGSKSYNCSNYKIKVTTGYNHTLDKKKYAELKGMINPKFDPVKEVVKLELNKKTLKDCLEFGTPEEAYLQSQFIVSTPKKMHVSIEDTAVQDNNVAPLIFE